MLPTQEKLRLHMFVGSSLVSAEEFCVLSKLHHQTSIGICFLCSFGCQVCKPFYMDFLSCVNGIPALHGRTFLELASISLTATSDKILWHLCAGELIRFLKIGDKRTRFKICMLLSQVEDCLAKLGRFGNQMVLSLVNLALAESFRKEDNLEVRAEALRTLKKILPSGRSAVRRFPYIMRLAQNRSEIPDLLLPDLDSLTIDNLSLYCQPEMLPFDWSFLSLFEHITGSFGRALGREPQQHSYLLGQNDLFCMVTVYIHHEDRVRLTAKRAEPSR